MKKILIMSLTLLMFSFSFSEFKTKVIDEESSYNEKFSQTLIIYPDNGVFPSEEDMSEIVKRIKDENYMYKDYFIHFILPDMIPNSGAYAVSNNSDKVEILYSIIQNESSYKKYLKKDKNGNFFMENIKKESSGKTKPFEEGVVFRVTPIIKKGFIKFKGKTNLPESMQFYIIVSKGEKVYDETNFMIDENGEFETEFLGNEGNRLKNGSYDVEIGSVYLIEDYGVSEVIGENGENLKGDFVKYDSEAEIKHIEYSKKITIK